jgi:hypothetical protein
VCGLALSYLLVARTSELFADDKSKTVHTDFGLLRSDLSFFDGQEQQSQWENRAEAATLEVRFRGSKADQQRCGAVTQHSGDALHILLHLLQLDTTVSNTAPLMSYTDSTNRAAAVKTVTSRLATSYLRHMVSAAGQSARASNYTLHSDCCNSFICRGFRTGVRGICTTIKLHNTFWKDRRCYSAGSSWCC